MTDEKAATNGYRVEVQVAGEKSWSGNALTFRTESGARAYASDLMGRWTAVDDYRVVAVEDLPAAVGENSTIDWAEETGAARPHKDAPALRVQL